MEQFRVAIAKVSGEDIRAAVRKSVELLGGMNAFVTRGDKVVVKPNMFINATAETGRTTHPAVIVEVAKLAKEAGAAKVTVAERNFVFKEIFSGYDEVYEYAEVMCLDDAPHRHVMIPGARNLQHPVPVPKVIDEADVFINCPGLRTHALPRFSNAMKNLMGILPGSNTLHVHGYGLEESFLDLNRYRPSDLVVTSAYWILEGNFPSGGETRLMEYLFSSDNVLAADLTAALFLGIDPAGVPMVQEAHSRGMGPGSIEEVDILGDEFVALTNPVKHSPDDYSRFCGEIEIVPGNECYACRWALAGGLTAVKDADSVFYGEVSGRVRVIVGPDAKVQPSPFNLFYGHCANRVRKETPDRGGGVYIPGCPPLAGFVKRGLTVLTRRPERFITPAQMQVLTVEQVMKAAKEGTAFVESTATAARDAAEELRRFMHDVHVSEGKAWKAVVLTRNGLATQRGLRFLSRITQEATAAREEAKGGKAEFCMGLDLAAVEGTTEVDVTTAARLIRRYAFACGAVIMPPNADDRLLCALIREHFGGTVVSQDAAKLGKRYSALCDELVRDMKMGK